jgi:peptidoglycan lytic transglycosylase G
MKRLLRFLLLLILVAVAAGGWWLYTGVNTPYKGYDAAEQFVEIPQGAGSVAIAKRLADAGVVHDANSFRAALWLTGKGRRLQAGEYRFDQPVTARQVADKIARGEVYVRPITFPEGWTIKQMAALYESKGFGPAQDFTAAAKNGALVSAIDPEAKDLEGYLFPDTYALPRKATAEQLVSRMVTAFMKALTPELMDKAEARGLSVRQFVTLASIVEKETGNKEERPLVAAVYANRLKIGMPLQCDPTVIYALDRAGRYNGNLTRDNLQYDSPYNTYRYPGLPPGPIASPGRASLAAAAEPAAAGYLYFVSRNDGTHAFASTLEEHNRNVQKYQVQYFRDRR